MSLKTYTREGMTDYSSSFVLSESDSSSRPLWPGDAITHKDFGGKGIIIGIDATLITVLWSTAPTDPFAFPASRRVFAQTFAKQIVSVQPMTMPSGGVFYLDYTYDSGSNVGGNGET